MVNKMEQTVEQLISNFKTLNSQITDAVTAMAADSRNLIQKAADQLFEKAPEIDHIFWTQYSPYFNDGSPCTFSVGDCYFVLQEDVDSDDIYYEGSWLYSYEDYENQKQLLKEVQDYTADPVAWRALYRKNFFERTGKECTYTDKQIYPYPLDTQYILNHINEIEQQRARYSEADVLRINTAFSAFFDALALIPDEIMQTIYGNHVRVKITKNGAEVDDYDHD
jgi:hypothetical protein